MTIKSRVLALAAGVVAGLSSGSSEDLAPGPRHRRKGPRPAHTYRGFRRNRRFGRNPVGNTKPGENPRLLV